MKYLGKLIDCLMTLNMVVASILGKLIGHLAFLSMLVAWIFGIAISTNFLDAILAVLLPPYAWILLAEALLKHWGLK